MKDNDSIYFVVILNSKKYYWWILETFITYIVKI